MNTFSVAEAKSRLSEILDQAISGEEVVLTRRGIPVARLVPMERTANVLGAGKHDPNITKDVGDEWWKAMSDEENKAWYE